jgi:hypothetical protein
MLSDSILFTISTIGPYAIFLMFFIYIFALVGMSLFAGKIKFDSDGKVDLLNGTPPRENFDNLGNTLQSLSIMVFGSWSIIMMTAMRCTNSYAALYFISVYIIGALILLNLFLAIMLGNFAKAKVYGQKKKIFDAFDELLNGQLDPKDNLFIIDACDVILGDLSDHVVKTCLKMDRQNYQSKINRMSSKISSKISEKIEDTL